MEEPLPKAPQMVVAAMEAPEEDGGPQVARAVRDIRRGRNLSPFSLIKMTAVVAHELER